MIKQTRMLLLQFLIKYFYENEQYRTFMEILIADFVTFSKAIVKREGRLGTRLCLHSMLSTHETTRTCRFWG